MIKKRGDMMKNDKGMSDSVSFIGWLLIATIGVLFLLQCTLLFNGVTKMNDTAELLSKKIQLSGAVNGETQKLLNDCLKDTRIHHYTATVTIQTPSGTETVTITESSVTSKKIQLNNSYTVIVKGDTSFCGVDNKIGGKAVGISEVYSK